MPRASHFSRRVRFWSILAAGLVVALGVTIGRHRSYRAALATLHVELSSDSVEMASVVNTFLARTPIGSSSAAVSQLLESLGFARSADEFDRHSAFSVDSGPGRKAIYAHRPFDDPFLSLDRFVCDRPALRITFKFDDAWALSAIDATTARGCI
jgi:hypothetical protein